MGRTPIGLPKAKPREIKLPTDHQALGQLRHFTEGICCLMWLLYWSVFNTGQNARSLCAFATLTLTQCHPQQRHHELAEATSKDEMLNVAVLFPKIWRKWKFFKSALQSGSLFPTLSIENGWVKKKQPRQGNWSCGYDAQRVRCPIRIPTALHQLRLKFTSSSSMTTFQLLS